MAPSDGRRRCRCSKMGPRGFRRGWRGDVITNSVIGDYMSKAELRSRIRADRRARLDQDDDTDARSLASVVLEMPEMERAGCVCLFASVGGEVGTGPLREALSRRDIRVLIPVVLPDGVLDWAEDAGADQELPPAGGPGGPEPPGPRLGPEAVTEADIVFVPALAVDTLGRRLGQGAGYYDRVLARLSAAVPVVALVHEEEVLDAAVEPIPTEPHDLPVHAVVTPRRCLHVR